MVTTRLINTSDSTFRYWRTSKFYFYLRYVIYFYDWIFYVDYGGENMNEYKVELKIIGHENLEVMIDYQTAHLMMLSEYVTIAGNTIRVGYKEASSEGNIKLSGMLIIQYNP